MDSAILLVFGSAFVFAFGCSILFALYWFGDFDLQKLHITLPEALTNKEALPEKIKQSPIGELIVSINVGACVGFSQIHFFSIFWRKGFSFKYALVDAVIFFVTLMTSIVLVLFDLDVVGLGAALVSYLLMLSNIVRSL